MFTKHNLELLFYTFCVGKKESFSGRVSLLLFELILLFSLIMSRIHRMDGSGSNKNEAGTEMTKCTTAGLDGTRSLHFWLMLLYHIRLKSCIITKY